MPRIFHYRQKCIGCGICYELQPDIWRMSRKDGRATLVKAIEKKGVYQLKTDEPLDRSQQVAKACTVNAIKVEP